MGGEAFDLGSVLAGIGQAGLNNEIEIENEDEFQTIQVLASIPQGRQLRDDARALGWISNYKFRGKLILATETSKAVTLDGGLKLTVAGPMQPALLALQEAHDEWLRKQKKKKQKDPKAALAAFADQSVPNLSSIVLLAELDGKRMLLTGDARGDKILEGMELVGLIDMDGKRHVDVLKVPHHGSDNNMETVFFQRVTADHYVMSGDGEHGNRNAQHLKCCLRHAATMQTIRSTSRIRWTRLMRRAKRIGKRSRPRRRTEKRKIQKLRSERTGRQNSTA